MGQAFYNRLHLHVGASPREVIAAARSRMTADSRRDPTKRDARHSLYRDVMLAHLHAQELVREFRL